jgi:hypothetical protein
MTLTLKRARTSRPDGQWSDEDYDVLADGKVVGRIYGDESASIVRAGSLVGACRAYVELPTLGLLKFKALGGFLTT